MAKPTSTYNLIKTYKDLGYAEDGNRYACPHCKAMFLKRYPKADPTTNLYARSVRKAIIFTHPEKTSVAACPCGFRRANKSQTHHAQCHCGQDLPKGRKEWCYDCRPKTRKPPVVVDNGDGSASIKGEVTGYGF
jgi:hypothetical protein